MTGEPYGSLYAVIYMQNNVRCDFSVLTVELSPAVKPKSMNMSDIIRIWGMKVHIFVKLTPIFMLCVLFHMGSLYAACRLLFMNK